MPSKHRLAGSPLRLTPHFPEPFTPRPSHRPTKPEKVECAGLINVRGNRMEEAPSVEMMEVLVCASGVIYGAVLAYGLRQQWRWVTDPPE